MKKQEKPKYNLWQCQSFMMNTAWEIRKSVLFVCVIAAILQIGLNLLQLFISPQILSCVEQGASIAQLLTTIAIFSGGLFVLTAVSGYVKENRMPAEIDVRSKIIEKISDKSCTTSYPNVNDPEIIKLQNHAIDTTSSNAHPTEHVWRTLTSILANIGGFVIYLFLLSGLKPLLLCITVLTTVISFLFSKHMGNWSYAHRQEEEKYLTEMGYIRRISRSNQLAKDIRIFGLSDWLTDIHKKSQRLYVDFISKKETKLLWGNLMDVLLTFARNGIAYYYLISLTLEQGLAASEFLLYFTAISGFTAWVNGILTEANTLVNETREISYVVEYLNIPEPFLFEEGCDIPCATGYELTLEDVTFAYPGTDKNILENVNLRIRAGEKLAIVGLNGAGKTTLIKLLCGFYDPDKGRVLLNGTDIRTFNRRKYYELFSAVFQEFSIPDVTIAENVAQTTTDIDLARVNNCLKKAGLTGQIEKLTQGLDSHVGREVYLDGVLLSGGQTQRLMLARALYKNGPILVLDEPTAALDPLAENDIYMKYNEMTQDKTSVFISHRLASTRFCDRIIFVADGNILEEGTHEELLTKNGEYAKLFEVQSRYYKEGGMEHEEE